MRSHRKVEFKRAPQVERVYDTNDFWGVASRMNYFKQRKDNIEAKQRQGIDKIQKRFSRKQQNGKLQKGIRQNKKNIGELTLTRWNTNNRTIKSKRETFRRND